MVTQRKKLKQTLLYIVLLIVFFVYVFPTLWIVTTSFKMEKDAFAIPPKIFFKATLDNYIETFARRGMVANFYNSVVISLGSSILALLFGTPAAYALSRFKFKRKEELYFWFLSTRMAPPIFAALPFFMASREFGVYDTRGLLVFVYMLINLSWVVWMMRSFFDDIPIEIDEACLVDGCTRASTLGRVILPLAAPGLISTVIFCLILSWNEYFFALVLTSVNAKTLPAAISTFLTVHGLMWGQMCAASTTIMLPILIFVLFVQRHLIRGLTMGAVKS